MQVECAMHKELDIVGICSAKKKRAPQQEEIRHKAEGDTAPINWPCCWSPIFGSIDHPSKNEDADRGRENSGFAVDVIT